MAFSERIASWTTTVEFPGDVTGAIGDSVTVVPVVVALAALSEVALAPVLVWFGVAQVVWGARYGVPVSVEPMKALAALAIAGSLSASGLAAAGLLAGGTLLVAGATGALGRISRFVGQPVVRGVQLAVALVLFETALDLATTDLVLAGVAIAVAALVAVVSVRTSAIAVVSVGAALALAETGGISPAIPAFAFALPSPDVFLDAGTTQAAVGQLAMSIGNAAVATALLLDEYFDSDATADDLATSMGAMNLFAVPLGAIPMCHGSGGVAGKYAFGARTAAANVVLGVLYLLAAVLAVGVVAAFPVAMLGVVLAAVAAQLAHTSLDTDQYALTLGVGVVGLLAGVGVAFVAGLLADHASRRFA
ncbi:putative sulfate/molybdate transporter [Halobacterium sp. KA-4]|uniref:putative sulfate/molybdate transporter n=1 Tax=Halobacterium sp. KA-4 TaxID=2896367 RepID=UPI001E39E54D|nr:putative sulfate/molybdate transporter [Halobacterium sp. KA-4]MCD2201415.1 putative sulfate/molybdate transporter [Halobacterium sp. KA-4]